jgi:hypothetical protein
MGFYLRIHLQHKRELLYTHSYSNIEGVQGAKPPEADEFLHVKGGFFYVKIMNI